MPAVPTWGSLIAGFFSAHQPAPIHWHKPLARFVKENYNRLPKPYRVYRAGYVFRNEKPGPGRFRQFMQFDADIVVVSSIRADAEICMMVADTLESLGIAPSDYVIKINNRKILEGVMVAIGLDGENNTSRRLVVLRLSLKIKSVGCVMAAGCAAMFKCGACGRL